MKRSVKVALATSALAVAGGLFLATSSFAERGFGPGHWYGPYGYGGPMGGFGEMRREMLKRSTPTATAQSRRTRSTPR